MKIPPVLILFVNAQVAGPNENPLKLPPDKPFPPFTDKEVPELNDKAVDLFSPVKY